MQNYRLNKDIRVTFVTVKGQKKININKLGSCCSEHNLCKEERKR